MNELSLFTGAGGGVLGTKLLGWKSVGYVEWDKYCQQVLAQRIEDGFLNEAPIFGDIDHFIESGASKKYAGFVDVVTAGFPCQPFSVAGKKRGQDDERNKWPQTIQCLRDVRPRYALLENVPGLLNSGYFGEILTSLAESGFDARWCVLGADDVGAPHRRKRLWIKATSQDPERSGRLHREHEEGRVQVREQRESGSRGGERVSGDSPEVADSISVGHGRRSAVGSGGTDAIGRIRPSEKEQTGQHVWSEAVGRSSVRGKEDVADSDSPRLRKRWRPESMETEHSPSECGSQGQSTSYWKTEPNVGRVANGVASRVDRLKALGNGQVPAVAATAWTILSTGT
ncbi:MAG: DNA cytosine methyltransferase [Luminiphilus sp.]